MVNTALEVIGFVLIVIAAWLWGGWPASALVAGTGLVLAANLRDTRGRTR